MIESQNDVNDTFVIADINKTTAGLNPQMCPHCQNTSWKQTNDTHHPKRVEHCHRLKLTLFLIKCLSQLFNILYLIEMQSSDITLLLLRRQGHFENPGQSSKLIQNHNKINSGKHVLIHLPAACAWFRLYSSSISLYKHPSTKLFANQHSKCVR